MKIEVIFADALLALKKYPDNYFSSVVTDPPYGLSFMNKHWDYDIPSIEIWKEIFRVLKHGGHILVACGTRTQHRMAVNIEDAGFEIRDVITWHYGSGFPKSLDISKAIDKSKGAERKVIGLSKHKSGIADSNATGKQSREVDHSWAKGKSVAVNYPITEPMTNEAKNWNGWGTALKPATEFWTLARKPLSEKTVAENVLKHNTGGININGCRISTQDNLNGGAYSGGERSEGDWKEKSGFKNDKLTGFKQPEGRFPANVIFDEHTGKLLDEQSGITKSGSGEIGTGRGTENQKIFGKGKGGVITSCFADSGGASRFFYCAKASKSERNYGLEDFRKKLQANANFRPNHLEKALDGDSGKPHGRYSPTQNYHPTVKPISLMRYLVKLITPPNGIGLDPFAGSGTTGIGYELEGFDAVLIEREKEYVEIAVARIKIWQKNKSPNFVMDNEEEIKKDTEDEGKSKITDDDSQLALF